MIGRVWYCDGTFKHVTELKRKRGVDALSYRQTYIISVKVTERDRVTVAPKIYILMRDKSKAKYIEALQKLQALHAEHNPEYDQLAPLKISCDAENAFIQAAKEVFGDVPIRICSFHIKQSIRRRLIIEFKNQDKKYQRQRDAIFGVIRAFVYSPFIENSDLIEELVETIKAKVNRCPSTVRQAVDRFIDYLMNNWLNPESYMSFANWNYYSDVLNGDPDTTNICSESVNYTFAKTINTGYKAYKLVCRAIKRHKVAAMDHEWNTIGADRLKKRKAKHRQQIAQRSTILEWFDTLSHDEQIEMYDVFLRRMLNSHNKRVLELSLIVDDQ